MPPHRLLQIALPSSFGILQLKRASGISPHKYSAGNSISHAVPWNRLDPSQQHVQTSFFGTPMASTRWVSF